MSKLLKIAVLCWLCLFWALTVAAGADEDSEEERKLMRSFILCQAWHNHCEQHGGRILFTKGPLHYRHLFMDSGRTFGTFVLCGERSQYRSCHTAFRCLVRSAGKDPEVISVLIDVSATDIPEPVLWGVQTMAIQIRRDWVLTIYSQVGNPMFANYLLAGGVLGDDWCSDSGDN